MAIVTLKPAPLVTSGDIARETVVACSTALNDPPWLAARRLDAWQAWRDIPPPNRHDELWRRVDLSLFKLDAVLAAALAGGVPPAAGCQRSAIDEQAAAQGVVFAGLEEAAAAHPALLEQHLMTRCVKPTDSYFAALHGMFMRSGVVLHVPAGVQVHQPLRATTRLAAGQRAAFSHTLVVLEAGASAALIEEFLSEPGAPPGQALHDGVVEIILGEGARLDYASFQDWGRHVWNFTNERAQVGKQATLHWVAGGVGSRFTKTTLEADMLGEGGTALLSGVFFADSRQQLHYDTQQNHIAPGCKSDLLYKNALRDEARTVWRGNIRVFPGAQKTDGYQANRNLQLSPRSRADSIPGLEIEADDVRCTHGATVGKIDQDQVFYLRSRGIPDEDARRLIVEGFFDPIMQRIPFEGVRQRFQAAIQHKMKQAVGPESL